METKGAEGVFKGAAAGAFNAAAPTRKIGFSLAADKHALFFPFWL